MSSTDSHLEPGDGNALPKSRLFRWLSIAVMTASVAMVVYLVGRSWPDVRGGIRDASLPMIATGWALATASTLTAFAAFVVLFRTTHTQPYPAMALGHLYFTAQMMKHLPGRVWGIAYQGVMTRERVPFSAWVTINVAHLMLSLYFAGVSAAVVLAFRIDPAYSLALLVVGASLLILAWRPWIFERLATASRILPRRIGESLANALIAGAQPSWRTKLLIVFFFSLGWVVYFLAWGFYGAAYPGLGASDGVYLCATYTLAWIVGYLVVVTPSGIGVRELVFAGLAVTYPADVVVYGMLIGRAGLLATDLALGLLFLPFHHESNR